MEKPPCGSKHPEVFDKKIFSLPIYPSSVYGSFYKKLAIANTGSNSGIEFKLQPRTPNSPCLMFVDNSLLFCKATPSAKI